MIWQTIDTAPKDKEILVCFVNDYGYQKKPTVYGPYTAQLIKDKWWASWDDFWVIESSGHWGTDYKRLDIDPTHWMPIQMLRN